MSHQTQKQVIYEKIILLAVLCLCAFVSHAKISYQSINNIEGTNIVLIDKQAPSDIKITEAVLSNNGKKYIATQIRCNIINGVVIYRLKFKRLTVFKNCKVILMVNGKKEIVDIQKGMSVR